MGGGAEMAECSSCSPSQRFAPFLFSSTCAVGAGARGVKGSLFREAGGEADLLKEGHVVASYSDFLAFKVE